MRTTTYSINRRHITRTGLAWCALLLFAWTGAHAQWVDTGLVQNNSFEANGLPGAWPFYTCTISGWITSGCNHMINSDASGPFHDVAHLGNVPHGTYVAGTQGPGMLSQNISGLVNGRHYRLDLYVNERFGDGGYMDLRIWMGSQVLYGPTQITPRNPYYFLQLPFTYNAAWGNTLMLETLNPTGDATILFDYVRIFTPVSYTVGYAANPAAGGTVTGPGSINHSGTPGSSITVSIAPNAGYSLGSISVSNGSLAPAGGTNYTLSGVTANTVVTGNFNANTYTVTFDGNGGSAPSPPSKSVTFDATYGALATTSRTGYSLNGWFTQASGGTQVTSGTTVTTAAPHTLYAQWQINTYTVTFDLDGKGTRTGGGALVQTVAHGDAAVAPVVVGNTGWVFDDWDVAFDNITGALTVTAQYNVATYTVIFDLDGKGTHTGGGDLVQTVAHGDAAVAPVVVGNTGWVFDDWDVAFDTITGALTVTAQYNVATYTVTFDLDGKGTRTGGGDLVQTVAHGDAAVAPVVVGNTGWVFDDWDVAFDTITGALTVTAQYNVATYTVTFDLDGKGTRTGGGDLVQTVAHGDAAVAPVVVGNTGWVFDDWDVAFDTITGTLTVTALYNVATYTVTFDLDGKGTRTGGGDLVQTVAHGDAAVAPVVVGNTGWIFDDWDVAFDNITGTLTVTALYNVATYTVTFDLDGKGTRTGGGDLVQTVAHGDAAVAPVVVGNTGWIFDDWDVAFDNITGTLTVTAQYSIATYTVTFDLDGKGTRTGGGDLVQTVAHGDAAVAPVVVGNTGWVFDDWDVAFDTITGVLTVTAQYTAVAEGEAPEGEAPEGEAPEGEAPEGEAPEGEAPEGEAPEGEAPEGEAPEGEAPEGEAPEGEDVGLRVLAVGNTTRYVILGEPVTLSVEVQGALGALSYQWYRFGEEKSLTPVGISAPSYIIGEVAESDLGEYQCEVYDSIADESAWSPVFTLILGSGLPVTGLAGVALLATLSAIAGVGLVRRRR